jgi:alkanesulfonate monooxygenase SsuD/methylene tetrahydromethanopterin reductase-like flavin-dependent oxidoreductase (luciferase family)
MFPNPPGLLRLEPHSDGLRDRIWWGAGSNATAIWAAKLGMNLQSSTLKNDEVKNLRSLRSRSTLAPDAADVWDGRFCARSWPLT